MAGILRTDTIQNSNTSTLITQTNSTTITIGTSGQTVALASGASSSGFGATYNGAINWDTTAKTTTVTAASGVGYFINTTSGAVTVNLPAGSAGSVVALSDYAGTWNTNNVTLNANGSEKIGGVAAPASLNTQGQSVTFVYVDSTRGWVNVGDATYVTGATYVAATGGTITTSGNYKIHTFTGPGTFTVTSTASSPTNNVVDYLVVAGGGGSSAVSGGGAGGFRASSGTATGCYTAGPAPLTSGVSAIPVTATSYPITIGAGGPSSGSLGSSGGPGTPSTGLGITSTAGGGGGDRGTAGQSGGSGGGAGDFTGSAGGSGNTPPVSPPQGNNGGPGAGGSSECAGGGGGAATAGTSAGVYGNGVASSITGSPLNYAYGGFGDNSPSPSAPLGPPTNRGFGGNKNGNNSGSGVVVIRYRYQ